MHRYIYNVKSFLLLFTCENVERRQQCEWFIKEEHGYRFANEHKPIVTIHCFMKQMD